MSDRWPEFDVERDSPTFALLHLSARCSASSASPMRPGSIMAGTSRFIRWPRGWRPSRSRTASGQLHAELDLCPPRHRASCRRRRASTSCRSISAASRRFIDDLIAMLDAHGLPSDFNGTPNEIADAVPFAEDAAPREYRPDSRRAAAATRWRASCRCSSASAPASSARPARSISSGAASTSP